MLFSNEFLSEYKRQALKRMPRRKIKSLIHLKGDSCSLEKLAYIYAMQIHFYIYLRSHAFTFTFR